MADGIEIQNGSIKIKEGKIPKPLEEEKKKVNGKCCRCIEEEKKQMKVKI